MQLSYNLKKMFSLGTCFLKQYMKQRAKQWGWERKKYTGRTLNWQLNIYFCWVSFNKSLVLSSVLLPSTSLSSSLFCVHILLEDCKLTITYRAHAHVAIGSQPHILKHLKYKQSIFHKHPPPANFPACQTNWGVSPRSWCKNVKLHAHAPVQSGEAWHESVGTKQAWRVWHSCFKNEALHVTPVLYRAVGSNRPAMCPFYFWT